MAAPASAGPGGDDPAARLRKQPRAAAFIKRAASIWRVTRSSRAMAFGFWLWLRLRPPAAQTCLVAAALASFAGRGSLVHALAALAARQVAALTRAHRAPRSARAVGLGFGYTGAAAPQS